MEVHEVDETIGFKWVHVQRYECVGGTSRWETQEGEDDGLGVSRPFGPKAGTWYVLHVHRTLITMECSA